MKIKYLPIFLGLLLFVIDRVIKYIFVAKIVTAFEIFSWLRFELWMNDGLAFGLFSGSGLIISLVGIIIFLYFLYRYYYLLEPDWYSLVGVWLVVSGALSNLIDRFFYQGQVVDFVNLTFYSVFNLADIGIVIGLFILMLRLFREKDLVES